MTHTPLPFSPAPCLLPSPSLLVCPLPHFPFPRALSWLDGLRAIYVVWLHNSQFRSLFCQMPIAPK